MVVGIREKVAIKWPLHRKLMMKIASFLGNFILLLKKSPKCSDILSRFFGADTKLIKNLIKDKEKSFELQGYKILFDILKIFPIDEKENIAEVPYIFGERKFGRSKIKFKHIVCYLKSLFR